MRSMNFASMHLVPRLVHGDADHHDAEEADEPAAGRQVEQRRRHLLRLLVAATRRASCRRRPVVDRDLRRRHDERPVEHRLDGVLQRSLASSPSTGSPTNAWMARHTHIAARPERQQHEQELAERLVGERGERALWLTWSLDVSPRANWIARMPRIRYSTPLAGEPGPPERIAPGACRPAGGLDVKPVVVMAADVPTSGDGEPSAIMCHDARPHRSASTRTRPVAPPAPSLGDSPAPSAPVAARRSPCPAARPPRRCSPPSPRPTCRGTASASGRSTSGSPPTATPTATPTSSPASPAATT